MDGRDRPRTWLFEPSYSNLESKDYGEAQGRQAHHTKAPSNVCKISLGKANTLVPNDLSVGGKS